MLNWIASYPKSGNTWTRMFLSAYKTGGNLDINLPVGSPISDIAPYFYNVVSPKPVAELSQYEFLCLRPAMLVHLLTASEGSAFVKTHWPNSVLHGMPTIPPLLSDRAIYIVRDPRDVVISYAAHNDMDIEKSVELLNDDKEILGDGIFTAIGTWSQHVASWTMQEPTVTTMCVAYEKMLQDPTSVFGSMVEFLGMPLDDDLLARAIAATSFDALRAQESERGFQEQRGSQPFFRVGKAGAWKDILTPAQVHRIETDHGRVMTALGYELYETKRDAA